MKRRPPRSTRTDTLFPTRLASDLPYGAYAMGIGYNIELLKAAGFENPPTTWAELREQAKALTNRDNGVVGFSFINDGANAGGWHFTVLGYSYGDRKSTRLNSSH